MIMQELFSRNYILDVTIMAHNYATQKSSVGVQDIEGLLGRYDAVAEKLSALKSSTSLVVHERLNNLFKSHSGIFAPFLNGGGDVGIAVGTTAVGSMVEFLDGFDKFEIAVGTLYEESVPVR
jgi:hypothetical protein